MHKVTSSKAHKLGESQNMITTEHC